MTELSALILGIIQGLTEFLPVSSSGHLVIFQQFFNVEKDLQMFFDITVHLGTLMAIIICFLPDVKNLTYVFIKKGFKFLSWKESFKNEFDFKLIVYILISTFITGCLGILFKDHIEIMFDKPKIVGINLIFTGLILYISERISKRSNNKDLTLFTIKDAFILGLIQSIALMPGISRSGITIACALVLGFIQKDAAKYSFLLAIPAIAGAFILELKDIIANGFNNDWIFPLLTGFITSSLAGILAIKLILFVLKERKLFIFSIYCWVLSSLIILFM